MSNVHQCYFPGFVISVSVICNHLIKYLLTELGWLQTGSSASQNAHTLRSDKYINKYINKYVYVYTRMQVCMYIYSVEWSYARMFLLS